MKFSKSELDIICQYAAPTKAETLAGMKEMLPLETDKALLLYFQRNHVPGFRVEPFYP